MKRSKFGIWRGVTTALSIFLALSLALTNAAFQWQNTITRYFGISGGSVSGSNGSEIYASDYDTIEELFEAKEALCIQIGEEGSVLLKNNNNALPISPDAKISLFGRNSTDFVVGTSSGGGTITGDDDLKTVLTSVGLTINETLWDFYSNSEEPKRRSSTDGVRVGEIDPSTYTDEVINSYSEYSDVAIVVISRNFGEGNDASIDPAYVIDGDGTHYSLQLHDYERAVIEEAKKCSENVIVIVNSDNAIEIGELKDDEDIDAILQVGGTGVYGLYGVANVLIGEVSPSGHLADTYAISNFSSPASFNYGDFSYTNNEEYHYIVYQEGIYVGYKYYETRYEDSVMGLGNAVSESGAVASEGEWNYSEEIAYPFGYGLSYTEFSQKITDMEWSLDDRTVTVTVEVENVGNYDGKDVVQLYVQSPYTEYDMENNVEKASVSLVGYEKTETLAPGESETVTVTTSLDQIASYDYTNAQTYILDYGTYYFAVGNGAHDAVNNVLTAKGYATADGMDYDGDVSQVTSYEYSGSGNVDAETCSTSGYTGEEITNQLESVDINSYGFDITYLSRKDWTGTWSGAVELEITDEMIDIVENGSSYSAEENSEAETPVEGVDYASEETDYNFIDLYNVEYDDEIWEDLLSQLTLDEMTRLVGLANSGVIESINMPSYMQFDGPLGIVGSYQTNDLEYAVSAAQYPSEPMWAATFNHELATEIGSMYGNDGIWTGYQAVWGPGCDTHRTPFNGRNAEYFSEDSVLAYYMAKDMTSATIEYGLSCGPKHLALNDQEVNRGDAHTFSNEQATREIYLRAFEGAMAAGGALDCMTAKNLMGLKPAAALSELLQNVVMDEWGFFGAIISDSSTETNGSGAYCVIAGLTQFDTMTKDYISGSGSLAPEKLAEDGKLFAATKEACHRNLYFLVNTSLVNGLSEDTIVESTMPWYQIAIIVIDVVFAVATVGGFIMMFLSNRKRKKAIGARIETED